MSSTNDPSVHCDCRRVSVRRAVVISLVIGVCTALLRELAFRGQPVAQAVCGIVVGLAIVSYAVARLYDLERQIAWQVYAVIVAVGLGLATLWTIRLF